MCTLNIFKPTQSILYKMVAARTFIWECFIMITILLQQYLKSKNNGLKYLLRFKEIIDIWKRFVRDSFSK